MYYYMTRHIQVKSWRVMKDDDGGFVEADAFGDLLQRCSLALKRFGHLKDHTVIM